MRSRKRLTATDADLPVLHERNELGEPVSVPHGALPSMHSFRHTVASRALLAGESVDEVAFLLGHRDANVTRAVYVRELSDARRRTMRRSRMVAEFGDLLRVAIPKTTAATLSRIEVEKIESIGGDSGGEPQRK